MRGRRICRVSCVGEPPRDVVGVLDRLLVVIDISESSTLRYQRRQSGHSRQVVGGHRDQRVELGAGATEEATLTQPAAPSAVAPAGSTGVRHSLHLCKQRRQPLQCSLGSRANRPQRVIRRNPLLQAYIGERFMLPARRAPHLELPTRPNERSLRHQRTSFSSACQRLS